MIRLDKMHSNYVKESQLEDIISVDELKYFIYEDSE